MAPVVGAILKQESVMLKLRVLSLVLSSSLLPFAGASYHVIIDGGALRLRGALVAPACTVATESRNLTVDMGQIRSNQFHGAGSDALPVPFFIRLTDCTTVASQNVGITFWGQSNAVNPHILRITPHINAAQGVGIALFTAKGESVYPNTTLPAVHTLHDGDNRLQFIAKYRATQPEVTGGIAEATAWFSLTYL